MSALRFNRLRKDFGDTTAVSDLDLEVASGESVVLLGPSGCGKTTTLRMVAGFERPTGGRISIGDTMVAGPGVFVPPERREVGVVFQSYALWPHMTVADNIGFGLTVRRRRRATGAGRQSSVAGVEAALAQVQLDGLGHRYPHELSGGQQQRVALARALVTQPRLLLLDEPLSNLDTRLREDMRLEIRRIQRESGLTMIYITHDRVEALALADRIVALNQGEIQQIGTPETLYRHPRTRFVALSLGPANFLPGRTVRSGTAPAVRLTTGQTVETSHSGRSHREGEPVVLCVRPPDIRLEPAGESASSTGARIVDAVFLGDEVHYAVEVEGLSERLRVVDRAMVPLPPGTRVTATVADGRANLLDEPAVTGSPEPAQAVRSAR
jgi:ABC-type Fe3+/spermidine/putrescine transport system ATPase subunit